MRSRVQILVRRSNILTEVFHCIPLSQGTSVAFDLLGPSLIREYVRVLKPANRVQKLNSCPSLSLSVAKVIHVKWVHCHHSMARSRVADRDGLQIWRVAANMLNKQSRTAWGLGGRLTALPRKTQYLLRITTHSLGTGRVSWQNLSTGKWT
jgi:hypothetical protein